MDRGEVLQPDATYAMPLGGEAYTRKGSNPLLGQDAVEASRIRTIFLIHATFEHMAIGRVLGDMAIGTSREQQG